MDLIDSLRVLSTRIANTKNAMVMPFIQLVGYNVFDPLEVIPELVSDIYCRPMLTRASLERFAHAGRPNGYRINRKAIF